jgi:hypothetical protein
MVGIFYILRENEIWFENNNRNEIHGKGFGTFSLTTYHQKGLKWLNN